MGALSFFRSVYDPDTLDTRFTNSSNVPYQTVIDARSDPAVAAGNGSSHGSTDDKWQAKSRNQRSRWNTPEFYCYFAFLSFIVPYMFWIAYDVSRPSHPRYERYHLWLSEGWIPGRKFDNTDPQYRTFRSNLPAMAALLTFHPLLRTVWNAVTGANNQHQRSLGGGRARLEQRVSFDYAFAYLFLVALHGFSAFKIIAILVANHQIATKLPKQYIPWATWVYNICVLFANELCEGYRFRDTLAHISPKDPTTGADSWLMQWGGTLDGYGGIMPRWHIMFNLTILRLISFNLDYYWSLNKRQADSLEKQLDPANLSDRDRVAIPADPQDYSFRNYMAYAIYAPLYLTGPIMTFNDYISQCKYRAASIERPRTVRYAVRFLLVLLCMEVMLHYDYVGAISRAAPVWKDYTAAQLSLLSLFNLHIIWLKLLLPWRFFRLWALTDGIDPPENMVRCVSNNYSTQLFWRAWHRSFNRWIVRYIYVPLGGASFRNWQSTVRSVVSYLMVFTFVALWHDIQMRMLIWGWLIVLFMLPEWTATYLFPARKWEHRPNEYRILCGLGGVVSVFMMISANLVGFAIGLDGLESILRSIIHDWSGLLFLTTACLALYAAIQVMFEIRETEKRKGISVKC
jgi:D-alanyl-lipoteichoic acid acyltransferase DltB (MBOAT superfamily)